MLQIGITGGIGSGKSVVAKILESKGYPVFYSDKEAKDVVHTNPKVKESIIDLFGSDAYVDGEYCRPFIAKQVFSNTDLLLKLNQIIHPAVRQAFENFSVSSNSKLVFNEAAILFETGAYKSFDHVLLVCSPMALRMSRLTVRDNATVTEIEARMSKQWSDERKRELTPYVIENDEKSSLLEQIEKVLAAINPH